MTRKAGPAPVQPTGLAMRTENAGIGPGEKAIASQIAASETATPPTAQRHRGPGTSPVGNHSRASSRPVGTPPHSQAETQAPATTPRPGRRKPATTRTDTAIEATSSPPQPPQ